MLGMKAGEILRKIHSVSIIPPSSDWSSAYGGKIDHYIQSYKNCAIKFEGDDLLIQYIDANRHLLKNRPQCLTHGDYHVGNLIISEGNVLSVIDFNRFKMVDPYHAFGALVFCVPISSHFATGQIRGYFEGEPPAEFWSLLALYMAAIAVNALPWSIPYGQSEIDFAFKQISNILDWFDNMQNPIPAWYMKDLYKN